MPNWLKYTLAIWGFLFYLQWCTELNPSKPEVIPTNIDTLDVPNNYHPNPAIDRRVEKYQRRGKLESDNQNQTNE